MKTLEVLNKYKTILSGILECNKEDIKIHVTRNRIYQIHQLNDTNEIGTELEYEKTLDWSLGFYYVVLNKEIISSWELYEMPHCCAIMVSCKVSVEEKFRGKRIGTILNQLRQDIGRLLNFSMVLCTDIEQNVNQRKLLKTNGWKDVHSVVNKRTNNRVYISVINI